MKNSIKLLLAVIMIAFVGTLFASVRCDGTPSPKTSIVSAPVVDAVITTNSDVKIITKDGKSIIVKSATPLANGCVLINDNDTFCNVDCLYLNYSSMSKPNIIIVGSLNIGATALAKQLSDKSTCLLVAEAEPYKPISEPYVIQASLLPDPLDIIRPLNKQHKKRKAKSKRFSKNNFYSHYT